MYIERKQEIKLFVYISLFCLHIHSLEFVCAWKAYQSSLIVPMIHIIIEKFYIFVFFGFSYYLLTVLRALNENQQKPNQDNLFVYQLHIFRQPKIPVIRSKSDFKVRANTFPNENSNKTVRWSKSLTFNWWQYDGLT